MVLADVVFALREVRRMKLLGISRYAFCVGMTVTLINATGSPCRAQFSTILSPGNGPYNQLADAASWGPSSHGWQLGIVGGNTAFTHGKPAGVVVLVRNTGPSMEIRTLEPQGFYTTLVDAHGKQTALEPDWVAAELDSTGLPGYSIDTNSIVKNTLHIDQRYKNLTPGSYRLTASINIVPGSSMDPVPKPVFAHLTSGTITITVLP